MKRTLHVFPDSGHQILFFPISDVAVASSRTLAGAIAENENWRNPHTKPWLKGRLGTQTVQDENGQIEINQGFWVAVDLNTGSADRGYWVPEVSNKAPRRRARPVTTINDIGDGDEAAKQGCHSPYIAGTEQELPEQMDLDLVAEFDLDPVCGPMLLEIVFVEEAGDAIPVNLIIDLGNSRTVVLGLEQTETAEGLSSVCKPILFPKDGHMRPVMEDEPEDFSDAIPDSWFVLMESIFPPQPVRRLTAGIKPVFEERSAFDKFLNRSRKAGASTVTVAPHQFTQVSPAVIGRAARAALSDVNTDAGGISFLSSPKRYIWDDQPLGAKGRTHWTMQRQPWRQRQSDLHDLVPLKGDIMRFMPNATADWKLQGWSSFAKQDNDIRPDHSRADSMAWVALAILEQAEQQIQSETWRRGNKPYLRRTLGDILLTYPAGWTEDEVERFRAKWERARDIFVLSRRDLETNTKKPASIPAVRLPLDEAVASQLAIVYAEMRHMRDYGENWIELYGRGEGKDARIRVMTVDIGGGTTDTSIVEYQDKLPGAGMDLTTRLIFKDSTTHAGDRLMKDIIERILLPRLGERFADEQQQKETFEEVFFRPAKRDSERAQWSVITRTVFVPIARQWLRCSSAGNAKNAETGQPYTAREAGASTAQIARMNELVREAGLRDDMLDPDAPLELDLEQIRTVINDWFGQVARTHGSFAALFDCDLVILTGKPSELPEVRTLLERHLPIESDRIISARDYFAGDWLPMSKTGNIDDAKLVTALGSAVYNSIETGILTGWAIHREFDANARHENHWGRIAGALKPFKESDVVLPAGEKQATARLLTGSVIGRARFLNHVLPEQVYKLVHVSGEQILIDARFGRVTQTQNGSANDVTAESLVLLAAQDAHTNKKIPLTDLKLQLCTLARSEDYWQETGRFEVRWAA